MWVSMGIAILVCIVLLFVPGFGQLRMLSIKPETALIAAPMVSVCEFCLLGIAFGLAGMPVSALAIVGIPIFLGVVGFALSVWRKVGKHSSRKEIGLTLSFKMIALYVLVGMFLGAWFYLKTLPSPDAFVQMFDNASHLNTISAFVETSRYSVLQTTLFPTLPLVPFSDISFYPAAWHVMCALCVNLLSIPTGMAENAVNFVCIAIVFPMGMYGFLGFIFRDKPEVLIWGSFSVLAFASFPWGFLVAGPLYSNMMAYVLLPSAMMIVFLLFSSTSASQAVRLIVVAVVGVIGIVLSQPNSFFTALVVMTPALVVLIYGRVKPWKGRNVAIAVSAGFFLFVAVFWVACWKSSFFAGVVHYTSIPYAGKFQALVDFFDFGYRNSTAQLLLVCFVAAGVLYVLFNKKYRWLLLSLMFFCVGYVLSSSSAEGTLQSFFTGFWFNDVDRIAASSAFLLVPLASLGLWMFFAFAGDVANHFMKKSVDMRLLKSVVAAAFLVAVFFPSYILAGFGNHATAFGGRISQLANNVRAESLTQEEIAFVDECVSQIGDDGQMMANFPFDGSAYAYGTSGANLVSRHFFPGDTEDELCVQKGLANVSKDPSVRDAARRLNVGYVLLLDAGSSDNATIYQAFLNDDDWVGVTGVNDNTPGFEIVLSDGDMRLYRLVA